MAGGYEIWIVVPCGSEFQRCGPGEGRETGARSEKEDNNVKAVSPERKRNVQTGEVSQE